MLSLRPLARALRIPTTGTNAIRAFTTTPLFHQDTTSDATPATPAATPEAKATDTPSTAPAAQNKKNFYSNKNKNNKNKNENENKKKSGGMGGRGNLDFSKPLEPLNKDTLYGNWAINETSTRHLSLGPHYKTGQTVLTIRLFGRIRGSDKVVPTTFGTTISIPEWKQILAAAPEIEKLLKERPGDEWENPPAFNNREVKRSEEEGQGERKEGGEEVTGDLESVVEGVKEESVKVEETVQEELKEAKE